MAITSLESKSKSMDVRLDSIIQRWLHIDSHRAIEVHLPQLIPLDYIDHIYMPQSIFDSLSPSSRQSINAVFKHCIDITPHTVPAGDPRAPHIPKPENKEREKYQKYVLDHLLERFKRNAENPPAKLIEGTIITIPFSEFKNSFVLPMTISQARDLYCFRNKKDPPADVIYIYWQALHGDMMLAVSGKKLEKSKADDKQPHRRWLLCYIAPISIADDSYNEKPTYLNSGLPFKHHEFVSKGKYKAKSNTFHLGSNTNDFVTYCLEIHRQSGRVVLRQAGSNAIYNHEEISCQFKNKKKLDVSKLEYVYVSANRNDVTVRNLIVSFERRPKLHPTFDRNFTKDALKSKDHTPSGASGGSSLTHCRDNVNCLLQLLTNSEGREHNSKYSHPCRFSELCRNKDSCSFTHDPHPSPSCRDDRNCRKITDPFHRAEYRHRDLPDFLMPCHDQKKCSDTSNDHRMKYSHGEDVFHKKPAAAGRTSMFYSIYFFFDL